MTATMFLLGWWILWLPVLLILAGRWIAMLLEPDDIDRLLQWEKEHWQ